MKLGDGVEQAIHCVMLLTRLPRDGVMSAAALAEFHGVSASYLLKHLQALVAAEILTSLPGPRGGYRLARSPELVSLLNIVVAVEGPEPAFRCAEIRRQGPAPLAACFYKAPCAVQTAMLRAEKIYRAELAKVSVASLCASPRSALGAAINERVDGYVELRRRR